MKYKILLLFCLGVLTMHFAAATVTGSFDSIKTALFDVGSLWLKAIQDVANSLMSASLTSPWTIALITITAVVLYYGYHLVFSPLNRIKMLGDLGYITEGKFTSKDMVDIVKRNRLVGDVPPVYPNGWFCIAESRDLKIKDTKTVSALGLNMAVFRGEDGKAHVIDAYCPHLGANLAAGGRVKGNCIECPFHGWVFRGDDGKCVHVPYGDADTKIPDIAKVKAYTSMEINGLIYLWYHAEGNEPTWTPPELPNITSGDWAYMGRSEHYINAHIEEVPLNGADVAHLGVVHSPLWFGGIDLRYMYNSFYRLGNRHLWDGNWEPKPEPEQHIGVLKLTHKLCLFGMHVPILDMDVTAQQIGPGIVYLTYSLFLGSGAFLQSLTPVEPLTLKLVHHLRHKWYMPAIVGKFILGSEALQVERDIMIWNNKQYVNKPIMVKSREDKLLVKHRRWFSQFYSEHSPRIVTTKLTSDPDW